VGRNSVTYDDDFYAWTMEQARLLRSGDLSTIDAGNIAEEIEGMGKSDRRELRNRLSILVMHLLKWRYQPGFRSTSWSGTFREQRQQVKQLLDESPSLRPQLAGELATIYKWGRTKAVGETGLPESTFPAKCPFKPAQILDEEFLPES
jgi:uncharacterized protein DUF29